MDGFACLAAYGSSTPDPSTDANTASKGDAALAERMPALYLGCSEPSVPVGVVGRD
jgi:hypothetical protein